VTTSRVLGLALLLFGCDRQAPPADGEEPARGERAPVAASAPATAAVAVAPRADDADFVVGGGVLPEGGSSSTSYDQPKQTAGYGVRGPSSSPDPHIAKRAALRDAIEFGMIGLINSGAGGDPAAPTAPWGRDDTGSDPLSARSKTWGDAIGDSFGAGGLGLKGIGEAGGGRAEGTVGLGSIGGPGHGAGTGAADDQGKGSGRGSGYGKGGPGSKASKPPRVRPGKVTLVGSIDAEVVKRVVRRHMAVIRRCYQDGLARDPALAGQVMLSFVIDASGHVTSLSNEPKSEQTPDGTTLADSSVVSCIERRFASFVFPAPEKGIVTVRYQLRLTPAKE
jgi:hypothetical protein